jgi:peptidoglycan/xylan/chitin deacetylase (PgdA/CDA1 family)
MTMVLTVPASIRIELAWVAEFALTQCLGMQVEVRGGPEGVSTLEAERQVLSMPSLFPLREAGSVQLLEPPLQEWLFETHHPTHGGTSQLSVPILFGVPTASMEPDRIQLGFDPLGAIFFMLSRFEELGAMPRDRHDRFPGYASLAHRAGFLHRPIVDLLVEMLRSLAERLWPTCAPRRRSGSVVVSCDVDHPFDPAAARLRQLVRSIGGDLLKRRDLGLVVRRLRNVVASRRGDFRHDPNHTFDWYTDLCEHHGRKVAFYFIAERTAGNQDGTGELFDPRVIQLIGRLDRRGHEIGMHGSYHSFRDPLRLARERSRMREACVLAGVDTPIAGNRQHYLRWDSQQTPDHLDAVGLEYDTSGGFADMPGFRYGTSHPFRMWSWRNGSPLRLVQRPLVTMECAVLDAPPVRPSRAEALDQMLALKTAALQFGGDFTLLWHNSYLVDPRDREMFSALVR